MRNFKLSISTFCILAAIGLLTFLFYPMKKTVSVSDFSWMRSIVVEEMRTVQESDWSVPAGGKVYKEKTELKTYVSVIDHYETVTEVKTRQVISHYNTEYDYVDNGNGTFTKNERKVPVYKTETYTETSQEPVYKQQPVYATKYYYTIDKWFDVEEYKSEGTGKEPYWNDNYTLKSNERDWQRSERYMVHYDDNTQEAVTYEKWVESEIGDRILITHNRLGIIYKQEEITKGEE